MRTDEQLMRDVGECLRHPGAGREPNGDCTECGGAMQTRNGLPAVNVKWYRAFGPPSEVVAQKFGCEAGVAERALQFAWDSAVERFWEQAAEKAKELFGKDAEVGSEGRSGGWLVVDGLPTEWDTGDFTKWEQFERELRADMEYRAQTEVVLDDIESNRWAEEGAELYNFVDTPKGPKCMVDLHRHLTDACRQFLEA